MKKMMKSTFCIIIACILLVSSTSYVYAEAGNIVTIEPNSGFSAELDITQKTLTVEGLGMLFAGNLDFPSGNLSDVTKIIIKEGITLLDLTGWDGSYDFKSVKTIVLPKSLKQIPFATFMYCESLETVEYGGGKSDWNKIVIGSGNDALKKADKKYNCNVPKTTGADTFKDDMTLRSSFYAANGNRFKTSFNCYTGVFVISATDKSKADINVGTYTPFYDLFESTINPGDFDGYIPTSMIKSVVFEDGITSIGKQVFYDSSLELESITIPKSVKKFGDCCFGSAYADVNIKKIIYKGTAADWENIKFGRNNYPFFLAEIDFASKTTAKELTYTLSQTNYIYDGKGHSPTLTIKNKYGKTLVENKDYYYLDYGYSYYSAPEETGAHSIVVTLLGEYSGTKTLRYYIRPTAPKINNIAARKGGFTVTWNKYDMEKYGWIDGFEVQYSTSKDFKSAKTIKMANRKNYAKKVTGLKTGKKYYVRVRAYSPGPIRSYWSKTVNVKAG